MSAIIDRRPSFVSSQIGARADHLLSGVEQTAGALANLFKGSVYACTSCLGLRSESLQTARVSLHKGGEIVARIYTACLGCINPRVETAYSKYHPASNPFDDQITSAFNIGLKNINKKSQDNSWYVRNVSARVICVILAVFSVIGRSITAVIGVAALPFSLTSAALSVFTDKASFPKLHGRAQHGLLAPLVIHDLFTCAIGFIYPRSLLPVQQ